MPRDLFAEQEERQKAGPRDLFGAEEPLLA